MDGQMARVKKLEIALVSRISYSYTDDYDRRYTNHVFELLSPYPKTLANRVV